MHLSGLDRFLWAANLCGFVVLLLVLVVRPRAKSFPVFTAYVVENIIRTLALHFVLYHFAQPIYYYSYWAASLVDEAFQLLVFYELAVHVFCPTGKWALDVRKAFAELMGASILVALLLTWLAHPTASQPIQVFFLRTDFFSAALMSELFVGTMALSLTVGLPWKTHVSRIAQGLGAFSLVCVAKDIAANYAGLAGQDHVYRQLDHLRIMAFLTCEAYWIVMLWMEAPAPRELPEAMRIKIYTLQRQLEYDLKTIRVWREIE